MKGIEIYEDIMGDCIYGNYWIDGELRRVKVPMQYKGVDVLKKMEADSNLSIEYLFKGPLFIGLTLLFSFIGYILFNVVGLIFFGIVTIVLIKIYEIRYRKAFNKDYIVVKMIRDKDKENHIIGELIKNDKL